MTNENMKAIARARMADAFAAVIASAPVAAVAKREFDYTEGQVIRFRRPAPYNPLDSK